MVENVPATLVAESLGL